MTCRPSPRFFRAPFTWTSAYCRTFLKPSEWSPRHREKTENRINRLTAIAWVIEQPRTPFSKTTAQTASACKGVYRFYRDGELQYIGTSRDLRRRLVSYFREVHNDELGILIASGNAEVEWKPTPFHGWWEELEMLEYRNAHDDKLPPLNRKMGGASLEF